MRGPGTANIDLAVQKNFRITERQRLEFRGSFYNLPNHANFGNPNTTQNNSAFGRITTSGTPRVVEFGLRYAF